MGSLGYDNYRERCKRRKAKEEKLIAKGIKPGTNKFYTLMARR